MECGLARAGWQEGSDRLRSVDRCKGRDACTGRLGGARGLSWMNGSPGHARSAGDDRSGDSAPKLPSICHPLRGGPDGVSDASAGSSDIRVSIRVRLRARYASSRCFCKRAATPEPEPGRDGMALHRNPWHDLEGSPADELHAAVIAAEVSYAGELAVQAYLDRLGCGNEEDITQIASALQRVCTSRAQLLLMARWVEQRVRDRLGEPTTRALIERVAEALLASGSLDRAAFERLVTDAEPL